jgi:hypothetical protein
MTLVTGSLWQIFFVSSQINFFCFNEICQSEIWKFVVNPLLEKKIPFLTTVKMQKAAVIF